MPEKEEWYWKGRKIDDLSKEELKEALLSAIRLLEEERKLHRQSLDILSPIRKPL